MVAERVGRWVGGRLVESRMCESMMEGLLS